MPEIRSTVMRLERQIQLDQSQALTALAAAYEQLSEAVLTLARNHGYLGSDPLGGLAQMVGPASAEERRVGEAVSRLWSTFFACFRSDEAAFEAARFAEKTGHIRERLEGLPVGGWPPLDLSLEMVAQLDALWEERHEAISERLDTLIQDLGEHQAKLGGIEMEKAYQQDELGRAMQVLAAALREMGEPVAAAPKAGQLLAQLVGRYRKEISSLKERIAVADGARRSLLSAIHAAAGGTEAPALPPAEQQLYRSVKQLVDDRRAANEQVRQLRSDLARLQAEGRTLMEEVAERDRRLSKYEFGQADDSDEDERLSIYRKAFAELGAGRDGKQFLDRVRELERIITIAPADEKQALTILDRQGAEMVKCLHELRAVVAVGDDPKRLRPRLLLGSRYDFKTLPGHAQAIRDAGRDLQAYLARARWAQGVQSLAKDLPKLQRVFREMVRLVADWRERLGEPPPASISVRVDLGSAIVSLPALLATDLDSVLRRRGKVATQAAADITPVLDEVVTLYHKSLEKARGEEIARDEVPKREGVNGALSRLAGELTKLGGMLEAAFSEAVVVDFQVDEPHTRLLANDHLMLLALQQLDVACDVLAVLPGAPKSDFIPVPSSRGNLDKLLAATRTRVGWLEDVARYRYQGVMGANG